MDRRRRRRRRRHRRRLSDHQGSIAFTLLSSIFDTLAGIFITVACLEVRPLEKFRILWASCSR